MPFIEVLRPMTDTLRTLDIRDISYFSFFGAENTAAPLNLPPLMTIEAFNSYFDDKDYLGPVQDLVARCHNLRRLAFEMNGSESYKDATSLATRLLDFCPLLYDLELENRLAERLELFSRYTSMFIRNLLG
ncbi:hypothetical protein BGZ47_009469 [Haplosporangium gracile]|nr:hypothetical protein BGZ47_009469 [Haplosporangium gracile]